ncbi:MAG TPA: DsbC family protein [Rudaea sp.]
MFSKPLIAIALAALAGTVLASDDAQKTIAAALHTIAPQARIDSISPSELPGFHQAIVDGHVLYVSNDGKYLIQGDVYDIAAHESLTQRSQSVRRKDMIAKIPRDKQLTFAPPNPKYTITVFTDVDCPYCRQFHKQIAAYNQLGIAVNYVLYPLSIHPGADKKAVSVWCSKDRNQMYTAAMNGQDPGAKTCDNPISELTAIGMSMGVEGTPAIFTEDGTQLGGYVPPDQLVQRLAQRDQRGAATAK